MDKQSLNKLFDYHYWANHRLWSSLEALSEQEFTQPLGDGSPPIRTHVVRMVSNENLWVNYLWHGEVEFLKDCHVPTRASIRAEWDLLEEEMRDFLDELSPAALESRVEPTFLKPDLSLCVWEILLQIVNQATETRAQVCMHLQRLGSTPAAQDYFDFLSEQRQLVADRM